MGLFDFFKKKKKEIKKPSKPAVGKPKAEKKKIEKKEVAKPKKKTSGIAYRVLEGPHVTEKATALTEEDKYVFKVLPRTNKIEIKKAVEDLYKVDVINVRIINVPKRQRRLGKQKGWRKGYKKAIVKIKKGQKIEILPR